MKRPSTFQSAAICSDADRSLEAEVNARLEHGRVSAYSIPHDNGTTTYGMVFSFLGRSRMIEQDRPFIADAVIEDAQRMAATLEARGNAAWSADAS